MTQRKIPQIGGLICLVHMCTTTRTIKATTEKRDAACWFAITVQWTLLI